VLGPRASANLSGQAAGRWRTCLVRAEAGGVAGFLIGYLAMPQAPPWVHLLVWDGIIATFLFFWTIGGTTVSTWIFAADGSSVVSVDHMTAVIVPSP